MKNRKPLVSIGLPTYNGERFIRQSLDSLIEQDYENFELIISDNASTDKTPEICKEYVSKDPRIKYYRNERNLGAMANFKRVFELSSGEFFMFASDHDLWDKTFISRCVEVLTEDPSVVLCFSNNALIDQNGEILETISDEYLDNRNIDRPYLRFHKFIWESKFIISYTE
jgi:Glycosyltransferases involved in cell wall biogenesis